MVLTAYLPSEAEMTITVLSDGEEPEPVGTDMTIVALILGVVAAIGIGGFLVSRRKK